MITVSRNNSRVEIKIKTELAINCTGTETATIPFSWEAGQPYLADALTRYIDRILSSAIESARRRAYNAGWSDAKAHRRKQVAFLDCL